MGGKITIVILLSAILLCPSATWAGNANDCITAGREQMFDGTLSGLRSAYQTFDNCLKDPGCPDCSNNRELKFLHAVAATAMLVVRDNNTPIDSVFELAKRFDVYASGNYWAPYFDPCEIELIAAHNQYGVYEIPGDAPDVDEIRGILDTSMIPQIEGIIAELDSISDSPSNRFKIFLQPDEIRIFFYPDSSVFDPYSPDYDPGSRFLEPLEVDYGEALLLKGILTILKGQLEAQAAYDMYVDPNDMLLEKIFNNSFGINRDLLNSHPDFLKVLPTANDPNDGAAILAQARQDLSSAIAYYLNAIDYIRSEDNPPGTDPQDNEFLYIDPNDKIVVDNVNARFTTMRQSLTNDTVGTYPLETTKSYFVDDPLSDTEWELKLRYNLVGFPADEAGSFVASDNNSAPSPWEVTYISFDSDEIIIEMNYDVPGYWGGALFTGIMSSDGNSITNGTFTYWGPDNGTIYNMSGELTGTETVEGKLDLNPVYGSTARYPNPVNLRDLLPQFDNWNGGLPNTIGSGLGNDATLGGIVPDMRQRDWQLFFNLQPGGLFYLQEIYPWQRNPNGYADIWFSDQLIFKDPNSDTWDDETNNADIDSLYMGYDDNYLYGSIMLYDFEADGSGRSYFDLYLSYTSDDESSSDSIRLTMSLVPDMTYGTGQIYYKNDSYGYPYWEYKGTFGTHKGRGGIEFRLPWGAIPSYLPGRFISLNAEGCDATWDNWNGEENLTHRQIGRTGIIRGTVSYSGYKGTPIFIQAYTNAEDPDGSVVAGTVIAAPGEYVLEGIGLGWEGYVRAYTPLFGFNIFGLDTLMIEDSTEMFLWTDELDDVDLVLNNPKTLTDCESGDIETNKADWYCFDAIEGETYTLNLTGGTASYACMTLYDRDGNSEIQELYYWQSQQILWMALVSGRYYVKVSDGYYPQQGGTYSICMTNDITCPQTDIAGANGVGVKDCRVDIYDLAALSSRWLDNCSEPYWCDNADFDHSGSVNFVDFAALANEWLEAGI